MSLQKETFSKYLAELTQQRLKIEKAEQLKRDKEALERPKRLRAQELQTRKIGTYEDAAFLIDFKTQVNSHGWWGYAAGLATGSDDIAHVSLLNFFKVAKDRGIDDVFVGLDPDKTVSLKGPGRPVFDIETRLQMVASLEVVAFAFPIPFVLNEYTDSEENRLLFEDLTRKINPHCLITNELADPFWQEKKERAAKLGIGYLGLKVERSTSSTEIAEKIQKL